MKKIKLIPNKNCEKCGNPKKMYWCKYCESNGETKKCELCESTKETVIDKDYHKDCSDSHVFTDDEFGLLFTALDVYAQETRALLDSGLTTKTSESRIQKAISKLEAKLETL